MSLPLYTLVLRHSVNAATETEVFLPDSLFDALPSAGTSDKVRQPKSGVKIENDWRHGTIQIDWLDIQEMEQHAKSRGAS
jgi:hypothetical protein